MRFVRVSILRLLGGIAIGFCGLPSHVDDKSPSPFQTRPLVTEALLTETPVRPEIESHERISMTTTDSADDDLNGFSEEAAISSRLRSKLEMLDYGRNSILAIDDYTGTFQKREVVNGILLDEQTISIKCRHRPFSVYLVWMTGDIGREVIYIEGQNNGKMIAHDGGWKSRIPALSLPVDCTLAMRDTRYPVTTAGIVGLIDIMRGVHEQDILKSNVLSCEIDEHQQFDGRPCSMFTVKYRSRTDSPVYRKSVTLIDCEWRIPLHTQHFEWPATSTSEKEVQLDESTLIECYSFTALKMNCNLTEHDFDPKNPEYRFR